MKIFIQAATPKNAWDIARVHIDTWRSAYAGIVPDPYLQSLSYEQRTDMWKEILSTAPLRNHYWVAKDANERIVGFSTGGKNRDTAQPFDGEVTALYLLKEFHGRGIGKRLFLDSLEQLYRHGYRSAITWVLADNPAAQFYAKMDGEHTGEKWEEIGGKRLKSLAYGWPDILATLKKLRPDLRHPSIKQADEMREPDGWNHYPGSKELRSIGSPLAKAFGLKRLGIHHELLPPGRRTSWPHAEEDEEELIYVLEGTPEVWIDGRTYALKPGDTVAFPCGTGICHTFLNNSEQNACLLVIGESAKKNSRIYYPLNESRRDQVKEGWWEDVPKRPRGDHDGHPTRRD